jgi:hypothetical protein
MFQSNRINASFLLMIYLWVLSSCNIAQDIVGTAAPKADKLAGTYQVSHIEIGNAVCNYPGKNSMKNGRSEPTLQMMNMQLQIIKYSDELVGVGTPVEFELGQSPVFLTDAKTFRTVSLKYDADRTQLVEGKETIGFIKNNVLTLDFQANNARYLLTATKL